MKKNNIKLALTVLLILLFAVPCAAVNFTEYAYGSAAASSGTAANAWDWSTATEWSATSSAPWSNTMDYGAGTTHVINNLTIRGPDSANLLAGPNTFGISGSNDGSTWTTLNNVSGQSGWTEFQIRYFNFTNSNAYRYYKIDTISSNVAGQVTLADYKLIYEEFGSTLNADFTQNQTAGLYPLVVGFTDTSTGSPSTWNWSVNGVNEATTRNYTRLFNTGGNFSINLTVTATGSTSTVRHYVQIYNQTTAQFTANVTSGLSPLIVQFTDQSSNATAWNWSFFGTNYSSLQNPTYTFTTPGSYTIRMNASSPYSYSWQNKTDYITVSTLTSSFNANVTTGVNPLVVMFNDTSIGTGITWYNVSFGDGGWSNQSTFPAANLTHLYSTQGNYTVNWYVFTSTSSASSSTNITVWGAANALFSVFNTAGTAPFTTYLYDTSTNLTPGPATYYWMLGDGNTSTASALYYNWNITGTYSVNHSVSNGLSTSWKNESAYITVGTPTPPVVAPVASFYGGPQIGAPPLNVFFTDVSSNTPTAWNWSFGDGLFSTSQNPTHWYNSSGFYTVGLTATNSAGSNSTSQTNFIMVY